MTQSVDPVYRYAGQSASGSGEDDSVQPSSPQDHPLETIDERPTNAGAAAENEGGGTYDFLESYSKELVLSSFPVLYSDVFPAKRVKTHGYRSRPRQPRALRQQTSQRIIRVSPARVHRVGTSPYDIEWSQRMLERHFHVYLRSERDVRKVRHSSIERRRPQRKE